MGVIKEPKNVDFSNKSEPWTEEELSDFRQLMQKLKANREVNSKRLEHYKGSIMFPEKLEKANKMLKTAKLPKHSSAKSE